MAPAAESFISTTYHTERIGPAAALATIKKMQAVDMIGHNTATGKRIRQGWLEAATAAGLEISMGTGGPGLDCTPGFRFGQLQAFTTAPTGAATEPLKTLFTQEMLRRGILSSNTFCCPTYAHKAHHVDVYLEACREVFH
eukprot:SAG31_NODE_5069_length_2761_cov_11.750699_5_plen_139_part_01